MAAKRWDRGTVDRAIECARYYGGSDNSFAAVLVSEVEALREDCEIQKNAADSAAEAISALADRTFRMMHGPELTTGANVQGLPPNEQPAELRRRLIIAIARAESAESMMVDLRDETIALP